LNKAKVDKNFRLILGMLCILYHLVLAQNYLSYEVKDGDTINIIDKNGWKQGIWRTYWNNGDLRSETFYVDNKKNGLEIIFYDHPDCPEQEAYY